MTEFIVQALLTDLFKTPKACIMMMMMMMIIIIIIVIIIIIIIFIIIIIRSELLVGRKSAS